MATEIRMPQLGLTMEEGTVDRWLKQEGDYVKTGEPLFEVTTDKLTNEVEAQTDGVLLKIIVQPGTEVKVQALLGYIGQEGEAIPQETGESNEREEKKAAGMTDEHSTPQNEGKRDKKIRISPLARKMAEESGIDYSRIVGSGPNGRIVKQDILAASRQKNEEKNVLEEAATADVQPLQVKSLELMDGDIVEKLSSMRQTVAKRMYASAAEIPTVTQTVKVDVTELAEFRKTLNERREKRVSINDFILKAVAKALRQNPKMLVSLDGSQVIRRAHVNLGMAVALEEGLIVPVIKDADTLGLDELSNRAKDLAARARNGQLIMDESKNSTFTVSNLGMYGVESFTPIINQPDAAILGVNAIQDELMMDEEGNVVNRKVMRISLTFDHRLMDGSTAAKFEQDVRDLLQSPMDILL